VSPNENETRIASVETVPTTSRKKEKEKENKKFRLTGGPVPYEKMPKRLAARRYDDVEAGGGRLG